jgi:hypothetical protein
MKKIDSYKQKFWKMIYPIFPVAQRFLTASHIVWHEEKRQRYHIGWLKAGATLDELKKHLSEQWQFGNHFVAWHDAGQVLSWRRLESFVYQWHLRIYEDGEIRGHYEKTPEAHPVDHFREVGETDRQDDFKKFLGELVVEKPSLMHLAQDPTMNDPHSEITISNLETRYPTAG